jgi:type IV pilus assembly protein PilC
MPWNTAGRRAKPGKTTKQPKPEVRSARLGEADVKDTWRPKWLQYEKSVKKGDIADAVRSLGIMLSTSRGETGPLATLAEQYKGTNLGSAWARIFQAVQSGSMDLASAVRLEDKVFPKIVGDLLAVGSRSGNSAQNLQKAADILDEGADLSQKIKQAIIQPAILLGVIIAFLYAVILFVLPVFSSMFESFGKELPPLSRGVITAGDVLLWAGGISGVLIAGWIIYYRRWGKKVESLRIYIGRLQLKVPVLGSVLRSQHLTQMFSILSGLLAVGLNEREALNTAADASANAAVKDHLERHVVEMDRGTVAFADIADGFLVPLQAGYMLANGFNSGAEVKALDDLAKVYQRDAKRRAENLTTALEPISNGVVGTIFAAVLIACYLPVYDLFLGLTAGQ